jgi:cysteinyl-tRNA synthetase
LNDANGKMSKSSGEFLTVDNLIKHGYNPLSYRYMVLSSHYQKPLMFSYENLDIAENAYLKLKSRVLKLNKAEDTISDGYEEFKNKFKEVMDNNLNTSLALTTIYDVLKSDMNDYTKLKLINEFDTVLSLDLSKEENKELENIDEIEKLINDRNIAKANKDYQKADEIRNNLLSMGIVLKDTREGTIYEIVK